MITELISYLCYLCFRSCLLHRPLPHYLDDIALQNVYSSITQVHDTIRENYFDYVERMNETLVDFVFAYKTSQTRSLQSPTKYSGL